MTITQTVMMTVPFSGRVRVPVTSVLGLQNERSRYLTPQVEQEDVEAAVIDALRAGEWTELDINEGEIEEE